MIPKDHPRYESLVLRARIVEASKAGILADSAMIAHGRGEAFDYLIGEKTTKTAKKTIKVAAAALILAEHPVISVNGNTTALVSEEIIKLSDTLKAPIEINLFYRTPERVEKIEKIFKEKGTREVLGTEHEKKALIKGLEGPRANASFEGVYKADVVLVPLEDGDRAEALVANGKTVITIDLNPLSRTAKTSSITIVDNVVRAIPLITEEIKKLTKYDKNELKELLSKFDNSSNLEESLKIVSKAYASDVKS
ncbi:MAG: phosphopantothenate/pantothenate synthetase [Methanobacterium paludis]|nr:phosphopantothenate/pantothenate synthetase [Methanobacterium paludis]